MAPINNKYEENTSAFAVYSKKGILKKKKSKLLKNKDVKKISKRIPSVSPQNKKLSGKNAVSKVKQPPKKKKRVSFDIVDVENNEESESDSILDTMEEDCSNEIPHLVNGNTENESSNSIEEGRLMFEWIIHPLQFAKFISDPWEKRPYYGKRNDPSYYKAILSTEKIDKMLREHNVLFTKNIDVTVYRDGQRETLNPVGRATAERVWDFYSKGCSVRVLNPQTFIKEMGVAIATLQELFGCMVGANIYLTPPESQGFAPHYDDIEAFVLQIEGKKHWRVYSPRTDKEHLPRFSSENFTQEEISEPLLDVTLNAGDILYFPRGFIHQANTVPGEHSLHITFSCYQRTSWADLFEKMLPAALTMAVEEDVEFRRGLPVGYLQFMGSVHSDKTGDQRRDAFITQLRRLFDKVLNHLPFDAAVDQMAKGFMHDAFPPTLTEDEQKHSVVGRGLRMIENGHVTSDMQISLQTKVKLLRAHILRLIVEEDDDEENVTVYHYADNSLEYHGEEPQSFKISADLAQGIDLLINSYPQYVSVSDLPLVDDDEKISLASDLWQRGLLLLSD